MKAPRQLCETKIGTVHKLRSQIAIVNNQRQFVQLTNSVNIPEYSHYYVFLFFNLSYLISLDLYFNLRFKAKESRKYYM